MPQVAINVEGGLLSADLLDRIGTNPGEVRGQRGEEFGWTQGRLSDEIQSAFSDALAHWQAYQRRLAHSQESRTTITRESWIGPLLERLGYVLRFQRAGLPAAGTTFPISHLAGQDPDAPPVHIVGFDDDLDKRREDRRQSPHALVQDYLNRTDPLWGIVTNGRKLRLLRDSVRFARPSFIELDLEAMMTGNQYSEFVLLYRLVHRTRLPIAADDAHDCWLERYYQQGIEEGDRVRDHLRDGVEQALKLFGEGFLANPANEDLRKAFHGDRIDALGYYRQLLRLIYRLLFLMVAEERRLIVPPQAGDARHDVYARWYGVTRLRDRAERAREETAHHDLWESLKVTFRVFRRAEDAEKLGLAALDGELFGPLACLDLEQARLDNRVLLPAIFALSTFQETEGRRRKGGRRRVNYAGLDVEELGSVYESLLDYHPDVGLAPPRFDLVKGSERKTTGSYYTPHALVQELIESALVPVIEARLEGVKTKEEKEAALLSLKVCDPAAGSGHFLLAAARRIGRELARVRTGEGEPPPVEQRKAVREVIRHCIYAVDKNPLAVDLCKVALWIEGHSAGLPLSFLDHHVKCGDSLVGVFDLEVLDDGIPDGAYKALTGDDKTAARDYRDRNKRERTGQQTLDLLGPPDASETAGTLASLFADLGAIDERHPDDVQAKEAAYHRLREVGSDWDRLKQASDLWTAAFFAELRPQNSRGADPVPTTDHVRRTLAGQTLQGPVIAAATDLAARHRFFHWPIEFPDVLAAGGFDVMLGNPPWERIKLHEQEFFASRNPEIAQAPNKAARECLIEALGCPDADPAETTLLKAFEEAKQATEAASQFIRTGGRYPLTGVGDVNTYPVFSETFLRLVNQSGRSGLIVPTGIATADQTKTFFDELVTQKLLVSLYSFYEIRQIFHASDDRSPFCLITIGRNATEAQFVFKLLSVDEIHDSRRQFSLALDDIGRINPNTRTAPIFRSNADAELTKKIYAHVPVLIDEAKGDAGNPWDISFMAMFHMSNDSGLFRTWRQLETAGAVRDRAIWVDPSGAAWLPLYEAKMIHQFDHRWATFDADGETPRDAAELEKRDPVYEPLPRYWVPKREVEDRLRAKVWTRAWLMGWRDITNANVLRTVIAGIFPRSAVGNNLPLFFLPPDISPQKTVALVGNLSALVLDYHARNKVGGNHLNFFIAKQLAVLPPSTYGPAELDFIVPRVVELTYTSHAMKPFAEDLDYGGPPFAWDPERRALLRAELDAYYAYLYGLTRDELRYILDPADVYGEDYPSETFRVLKKNEIREFGEYRTQRLVLEAWDRFVVDGTFDPERLEEPLPTDVLATQLAQARRERDEMRAAYEALLARADESARPTLFVEGKTDAAILQAAWSVFYPDEPLPVTILPTDGTKNMGSLAGKGEALRQLLGDRRVLVLADNDGSGRQFTRENGSIASGGRWFQLSNGINWCLLEPTDEFVAVMNQYRVPKVNRPFTIENCFSAALRREAMAAGAWRFKDVPMADLTENSELARRLPAALRPMDESDDAWFYLMTPHYEGKDAFAEWVTAPERRTPENYAALECILAGLHELLAAASEEAR